MNHFKVRIAALIGLASCVGSAAALEFDQDVTPEVIFGSGNANGFFTTDRQNGIELGIRGKLRFDENGQPAGVYNSNGDGSYTFRASAAPGRDQGTADWNFDWSINSDFDNSSSLDLADLTYEFGLDGDPGPGTDFLTFDPITYPGAGPAPDHAIGDNATPNGGGTVATDPANYDVLINSNSVAQNSWRYAFFPNGPLANFNAKLEGTYDIYLAAFDNGVEVARTTVQIIMVKPDLEFDQNATPEVIFGSGNINGAFTTDRRNGIETALRTKLRFNAAGQPENTFNSNGDGTYSFDAGQATGQSAQTAVWGFEWSVNTDFVSNPAVSSGLVLSDLTYELGLDGDPGQTTDFLIFDNITPSMTVPFFDHAIGDNATGNGAGTSATTAGEYQTLIDNNNVAQNSWRYSFFLDGPLAGFDPTVDGTYTIYLLARDAEGTEVSRTQIQVLVGPTAVGGDVADVSISKTSDAIGLPLPGDSFQYQLTITSEELATATNVVVTDVLPDSLSFDSGSCDDGSSVMQAGQTISINLGDLPYQDVVVCTLDVTVTGSGLISNTATISADNDAVAGNNASTAEVLGGLVESVAETGDTATPTDNDYTRINNAIQAAGPGDTIMLSGLFDWRETNAFNSWAAGSNGIAGEGGLFETGADDFSILIPAGSGDFVLTAAALGDATVQGPGDLAGLDGEGFLVAFSTGNPNIEVSNLILNDFDLTIGFFFAGGGINVYDNTRILNNRIRMATDLAGNSTAGEGFQNIGLHYSFGDNIAIAGNEFVIPGDGMSQRPALSAASVAMQSNTSGNAYDGLVIENNVVQVLNAQTSDPEFILGFWENSNSFGSDVMIRNNRFENLSPDNDPALNMQSGFRITSQTNPTTGDGARMMGNHVDGANVGYEWLPGRFGANFGARGPLVFTANTAINGEVGIQLDSNGSATLACNRIVNNTVGIQDVTLAGIDSDVPSLGNDNWWGCNDGPNAGLCDTIDASASANVVADSWLVATLTANPDNLLVTEMSNLTLDVTVNSDGIDVIDCTLPDGVPVSFATDIGSVTPMNTDTVVGLAPAVFTAPVTPGIATVIATIDNEMAPELIDVMSGVMITSVDPDPLPGNVMGVEATINGAGFIPETVILVDGQARTTTFVNATTVTVTLTTADLVVNGVGTLELIADNTAVPGDGQSAPFTVNVADDMLFSDGFED